MYIYAWSFKYSYFFFPQVLVSYLLINTGDVIIWIVCGPPVLGVKGWHFALPWIHEMKHNQIQGGKGNWEILWRTVHPQVTGQGQGCHQWSQNKWGHFGMECMEFGREHTPSEDNQVGQHGISWALLVPPVPY